jgi:hypothetical protein
MFCDCAASEENRTSVVSYCVLRGDYTRARPTACGSLQSVKYEQAIECMSVDDMGLSNCSTAWLSCL